MPNRRSHVENWIKEVKNRLRRDKTRCRRFTAIHSSLLRDALAFNPARNVGNMPRQFYFMGKEVRRLLELVIKRPAKAGTR